ncbi:BT1 family-domain-containing protein [Pavlovales sp. CCMP2436]|nr:BT1 family-domain-containing protein [Pavlovales sp. CCMP2436]
MAAAFGWRPLVFIALVYGLNQGLGESLSFFASQYLLTDAPPAGLGLSPRRFAAVDGFANIPWQMKSAFGLLSDMCPIRGLRRTPYITIAAVAGSAAFATLAVGNPAILAPSLVALLLLFANFSMASPDVMIDAAMAERTRSHPLHGPDLQALAWGTLSFCSLVGSCIKGSLLAKFGTRSLFGASVVTSAVMLVPSLKGWLCERPYAAVSMVLAKVSIYIFLSGAIQPSTPVMFYWFKASESSCTPQGEPCFSPEFIGWMSVVGYASFAVGTVLYHRYFIAWSYRRIWQMTQVVFVALNLLDFIWVSRWNLEIGLPDTAFVLGEEVLSPVFARLSAMPMFIIAARLCPEGIEATLFALTMGLSNFGGKMGSYLGIGLLNALGGVDAPEFANLRLLVVIRSLTRALPLILIPFLVPLGSPSDPEVLTDADDAEAAAQAGGAKPHATLELVGRVAPVEPGIAVAGHRGRFGLDFDREFHVLARAPSIESVAL